MAEAIGIASGLLTLVGFALSSTKLLHQTILSFRNSKREVRQLKQELEALTGVLESLQGIPNENEPCLSVLKNPLLQCGRACIGFETMIAKVAPRAEEDRRSFRDWVKLRYMGDNIEEFKKMLEGYKSTICIALGDANLRVAVVTAKVLDEYKEMIDNTKSDLMDRLEKVETRLKSFSSQGKIASGLDADLDVNDEKRIQEERDSTQECISICTLVSAHIDLVRPNDFKYISTPADSTQTALTTLGGLFSARFATAEALTKCQSTLSDTSAQLKQHLNTVVSHQPSLGTEDEGSNAHKQIEQERLAEEYDGTKQSLDFFSDASERVEERRTNYYKQIKVAEDSHQVIISTLGDLISAKQVTAGPRSTQWLGQFSDESFQQLVKSLDRSSMRRGQDTQAGATEPFETRYGAGLTLKSRHVTTD